jgi:cobalt-factor III methyltransferase
VSGKLFLVSLGPGSLDHVTPAAKSALEKSDLVVGYDLYLNLINTWLDGKETFSAPLGQERERAEKAIEEARRGKNVALVSSGDIGIYAMAALVFEEIKETDTVDIEVIPGITAANACASLLGAPLSHDFATLSLSDLLCPWGWIEERAHALAKAEMCIALYNVQSKNRYEGVYKIIEILLEHKSPDTICGVVSNAYRPNEIVEIAKLSELLEREYDMFTTLIIGNRFTRFKQGFLYTERGYHGFTGANGAEAIRQDRRPQEMVTPPNAPDELPTQAVWVFSGTSDGNQLAIELQKRGAEIVLSVASEYGREVAISNCSNIAVVSGRMGQSRREALLAVREAQVILDATHPHATDISAQLMDISKRINVPYIRYERPPVKIPEDAVACATAEEAGKAAIKRGKRIFLSTGIKHVPVFLELPGASECEWFLRITPDNDNLEMALKAGIPRSHLCVMQGPFSSAFNEALWKDWQIDCVITKDSGDVGGFMEKASAAHYLQIPLIVIKRPETSYPVVAHDFESIFQLVLRQEILK